MLASFSKSALKIVLMAFAGAVLLDPGDNILHLKLPLLILACSLWAARVIWGFASPAPPKVLMWVLFFALIVPAGATLISLVGSSLPIGEPLKFQLMKEFSGILIIPIIVSEGIDLIKPVLRWTILIALLTLFLATLSMVAPAVFLVAKGMAIETGNAIIRDRAALGLGIGSFYYKTISVVVFPIAYHLHRLLNHPGKAKSAALTLMFVAAVLCTDSRAIVLGVFLVFVVLVAKKLKTTWGWAPALLAVVTMAVLPAGYFATFFHSSDLSNAAKLGHVRSYAALFNSHPTYLVWGQGADTEFYTQGFEAKTTLTELTYLDLIRWFGIPIAGLIVGAVLYPVFVLARRRDESSYLVIAYIAYLWEAASNPLLVCSFGALVVSAMWGRVLIRQSAASGIHLSFLTAEVPNHWQCKRARRS